MPNNSQTICCSQNRFLMILIYIIIHNYKEFFSGAISFTNLPQPPNLWGSTINTPIPLPLSLSPSQPPHLCHQPSSWRGIRWETSVFLKTNILLKKAKWKTKTFFLNIWNWSNPTRISSNIVMTKTLKSSHWKWKSMNYKNSFHPLFHYVLHLMPKFSKTPLQRIYQERAQFCPNFIPPNPILNCLLYDLVLIPKIQNRILLPCQYLCLKLHLHSHL